MKQAKTLPGYDEALGLVLARVKALGVERVGLREALGRVLREAVTADRDQPPFDRSAMDGFAVVSGEVKAGKVFHVDGGVAAGGAASGIGGDVGVCGVECGSYAARDAADDGG